ncbi:MAG: plasmid mobilization protein [Nereida ignava]
MDRSEYQKDYRQKYKAQAKRVNLTLTLSEYSSVARGAKASGQPVSAYLKRVALDGHTQNVTAAVPEDVLEELADLSRVIRTVANNVNQMARHSNRIGQVLDEHEVFLHIQQLEAELKKTIAKAARASAQGSSSQSG